MRTAWKTLLDMQAFVPSFQKRRVGISSRLSRLQSQSRFSERNLRKSEGVLDRKYIALRRQRYCAARPGGVSDNFRIADLIDIGAVVAHRPLPHHRAYGSVHGGSRWLR